MSSILRFTVTEEVEGGFTAAARVPNTQNTLRTEGDSLEELYKNIADVVEAYCFSTKTPIPPTIKVKLPSPPSSPTKKTQKINFELESEPFAL